MLTHKKRMLVEEFLQESGLRFDTQYQVGPWPQHADNFIKAMELAGYDIVKMEKNNTLTNR